MAFQLNRSQILSIAHTAKGMTITKGNALFGKTQYTVSFGYAQRVAWQVSKHLGKYGFTKVYRGRIGLLSNEHTAGLGLNIAINLHTGELVGVFAKWDDILDSVGISNQELYPAVQAPKTKTNTLGNLPYGNPALPASEATKWGQAMSTIMAYGNNPRL